MREVGVYEAKTKLPELIKEVLQGQLITITNDPRMASSPQVYGTSLIYFTSRFWYSPTVAKAAVQNYVALLARKSVP